MSNSKYLKCVFLAIFILLLLQPKALAADPGTEFPATSISDDQKKGSVLVFPYFTSSAGSPGTQNTRIVITNGNSASPVFLIMLVVNGANGSISNFCLSLSINQTKSLEMSTIDPGTTGFILAIAVGSQGEPINFNHLTGMAEVKLATGRRAGYKAEAIAAIANPPTLWSAGDATANLIFDGSRYNRLPRALAVNKLRSVADNNSTILILSKITGSYAGSVLIPIGAISGTVSNLTESANFSYTQNSPQLVQNLSASFPPIMPDYPTLINPAQSGWMKVWCDNDVGLFGLVLNTNPDATTVSNAYSGGHNLHKLTLVSSDTVTIPVIVPSC